MNRWYSIGPSIVREGQGETRPDTSGRTTGFAIARGGNLIYLATANGGVWRSDDEGQNWHSLMDAFDLNPQNLASDSLACGAIAIDLDNPDRIYVGTGDGPGGAYFGVGPISSVDGGNNWITETVAPSSPPLAGSAFYELAIDPADPNRVVAATRQGVYRREPNGSSFHWGRKVPPSNNGAGIQRWSTSVVASRSNNVTTFYAANYGGPIFSSTDGHTWNMLGTGFPSGNLGQIRLAVQPDNRDVLYALIANGSNPPQDNGTLRGVWRWDSADDTWKEIGNPPSDLFGDNTIGFQGWYDLAIAVDPNDINLIYLGGSTRWTGSDYSGSVYRSSINNNGSAINPSYRMTNAFIGSSVHADIHNLAFAPGESDKLWLGCDGGAFYSTNPSGNGNIFVSRNNGLSTLLMMHIGQHPIDSTSLFCGTQDNGGLRYGTGTEWFYSSGGDAGFQIVNWNNPRNILSSYVRNRIRRSANGGSRYSYSPVNVPIANNERALFYAPFVGTPHNPNSPNEADIVAFGSQRPWISTNFGTTWVSIPNNDFATDRLPERIRSLVFASATRLYAGTAFTGNVFRFDRTGNPWNRIQIDMLGAPNDMPLTGFVTDIAVDHLDPTGSSIYITLGGSGDYRHVWHFDGTQWAQRSGPAPNDPQSLLDVQANAVITDPNNPQTVYVGMDVGCWRSTDGGLTWDVFSEGLPDAAVIDLKIHSTGVIRASTYGRGVFERDLSQPAITVPGPPTMVSVAAVSQSQIDLNWNAPANNGGSQITGYKMQRRTDSGAFTDISLGNVLSHSDTGLSANTTYHYRVSAINSAGTGNPSNVVSATTQQVSSSGAPGAPLGFSGTGTSTTQINLRWSAPSNTGGDPITEYNLKRREAGSSTWISLPSVSGNITVFQDTGLRKATTYNYEITATNSFGTGPSNNTGATTKSCFILTAAYGSELETKAYDVHEFINDVVLQSRFKRPFNDFLKIYFEFSPQIANLMERSKPFKYFMKYTVAVPFLALAKTASILARPFVKDNKI